MRSLRINHHASSCGKRVCCRLQGYPRPDGSSINRNHSARAQRPTHDRDLEQLPLAENRWGHAIVNEEMDEGERIGVANMSCERDEAALRNIFLAAPFSLRHEHHYRTQETHDVAERSRWLGPLRVRFRNHFLPGRGIVRSPDVIRRRRRRPPTPPVCLPPWFFAFSRA